jgi:hypothetical protein
MKKILSFGGRLGYAAQRFVFLARVFVARAVLAHPGQLRPAM